MSSSAPLVEVPAAPSRVISIPVSAVVTVPEVLDAKQERLRKITAEASTRTKQLRGKKEEKTQQETKYQPARSNSFGSSKRGSRNASKTVSKEDRAEVDARKAFYVHAETVWRRTQSVVFPDLILGNWCAKEWGMLKELISRYDEQTVLIGIGYVLKNWNSIRLRFLRDKPGIPTLGFLLRFHESLVPEAMKWSRHENLRQQRVELMKSGGNLPTEWRTQWTKSCQELKTLGFDVEV